MGNTRRAGSRSDGTVYFHDHHHHYHFDYNKHFYYCSAKSHVNYFNHGPACNDDHDDNCTCCIQYNCDIHNNHRTHCKLYDPNNYDKYHPDYVPDRV